MPSLATIIAMVYSLPAKEMFTWVVRSRRWRSLGVSRTSVSPRVTTAGPLPANAVKSSKVMSDRGVLLAMIQLISSAKAKWQKQLLSRNPVLK
jgi:hypothetical protein